MIQVTKNEGSKKGWNSEVTVMLKSLFQHSAQSETKTVLDKAEAAIQRKDYQALSTTVQDIGVLCREKAYLAEPLLVIANHLGQCPEYVSQALDAAEFGARYARDSALTQQAVALILKCADILVVNDPEQAATALAVAVSYACPDSTLMSQALNAWRVAKNKADFAGKAQRPQSSTKMDALVSPPLPSSTAVPSESSARDFVRKFRQDSELSL